MVPHSVSGCMWSLSFSLSREGGTSGKRLAHAGSGAAPLGSLRLQGQGCCRVPQEAVGCCCWSDLASCSLKPPGFSALWCSLRPPYTDYPLRTGLVGRELNAM